MLGRINWQPTRKDIRYFSFTLFIVFALLALLLYLGHKSTPALWILTAGASLSLLSYLAHPVGKVVYLIWMAVTYVLARLVSPVVIAVIFYLVLTPISLVMRLTGRDTLKLKKPADQPTYFTPFTDSIDRESFRRQF